MFLDFTKSYQYISFEWKIDSRPYLMLFQDIIFTQLVFQQKIQSFDEKNMNNHINLIFRFLFYNIQIYNI